MVVFRAPIDALTRESQLGTVQTDYDVDFVKRIIALPDETIAIRDNRVYIDGEILAEPYLNASFMRNMDSYVVPLNGYFVMGDNRYHSNDSRHWDAVPSENIIGKAWLSYWPRYRAGFLNIGEWSLMSR